MLRPDPPEADLPLFSKPRTGPVHRRRDPRPDELSLGYFMPDEPPFYTQMVGITQKDRLSHFYVVGSTGTGKTKFLEYLIRQDIDNGNGFGIVDAHGDLIEDIKAYLSFLCGVPSGKYPPERVVLIDPFDPEYTVCLNPLERIDGILPAVIAAEVVAAFKKIWADAWGNRMEDLLRNSLIALIENDLTLIELPLFIADIRVRRRILARVVHPICQQYFQKFNDLRPQTQDEWAESTLNKVQALLSDDRVRHIFSARKSTVDFREVIDTKKILLVKLDRGRLHGSADLLGSLILAKIQAAAFSRTDIPKLERVPFYLYIDEFQNFATENFIQTLAEARKYGLPLTLAHQNLIQLPATLRASVISNCRLQAYFRISRDDANILAKESFASIYEEPVGWDFYIRSLQELEPRKFIVKNKNGGGVRKLRTFLVETIPEYLQRSDALKGIMGVKQFVAKATAGVKIGEPYLRRRSDVEKEASLRREALLSGEEPESFRERK